MTTMLYSASESWNLWYPRVVLTIWSILQFVLTILGVFRKDSYSQTLKFVSWACFISADSMSYSSIVFPFIVSSKTDPRIIAIWAAFSLLFLGGTDTFTAFSIEDNELWRRRTLLIIFKGWMCVNAIIQCFQKGMQPLLSLMVILIVISGLYNCSERILAHKWGSKKEFKKGKGPKMIKHDFSRLRDNWLASERSGTPATVIFVGAPELSPSFSTCDVKTIERSYRLFQKFRGLFTDMSVRYSNEDRKSSRSLLVDLDRNETVQVAYYQMQFASDEIHSRALLSHTKAGLISRICFLLVIVYSFLWFAVFVQEHGLRGPDIVITYLVFILEIIKRVIALFWIVFSRRQVIQIANSECSTWECSQKFLSKFHARRNTKLSMGQMDLFKIYSYHSKPPCFNRNMCSILPEEVCDNYSLTKQVKVNDLCLDVLWKVLTHKSSGAEQTRDYQSFRTSRGEWALKQGNYHEKLGWSVEGKFRDCSALIWTIATTLLYHRHVDLTPSDNLKTAKCFSDYFLYLLWVRPVLLAPDIIRTLKVTLSDMESVLNQRDSNNERQASTLMLSLNIDHFLSEAMYTASGSVLCPGIRLAHDLLSLSRTEREQILCEVWVEILSHAAINSHGEYHAQLLGEGGELFTILWLITIQLGLGSQYNFECDVESIDYAPVHSS